MLWAADGDILPVQTKLYTSILRIFPSEINSKIAQDREQLLQAIPR
jgi:hypothetical protein